MGYWITEPGLAADGSIVAEAVFDAGDPWFDGHFPGEPVLPAVAQLFLAWEAIGSQVRGRLAGFRRVKFKEMLRPGERLTIVAFPRKGTGMYSFKLSAGDRLACTGTVVLGGIEQPR